MTLLIYDVSEREVAHPIDGVVGSGMREVVGNPHNFASGVYFHRLKATPQDSRGAMQVDTRRMLYLRYCKIAWALTMAYGASSGKKDNLSTRPHS